MNPKKRRIVKKCGFDLISDDAFRSVLDFLQSEDKARAGWTCKHWRKIVGRRVTPDFEYCFAGICEDGTYSTNLEEGFIFTQAKAARVKAAWVTMKAALNLDWFPDTNKICHDLGVFLVPYNDNYEGTPKLKKEYLIDV